MKLPNFVGDLPKTWFDYLNFLDKVVVPNTFSGTTAKRPTKVNLGQQYFDTTLGYPVFVKQVTPVVWVNGAGLVV